VSRRIFAFVLAVPIGAMFATAGAQSTASPIEKLDSVARIGSALPFFAKLHTLGCERLNVSQGASVAAWSEEIRSQASRIQTQLVRRVPLSEGGEQRDNQELAADDSYSFRRIIIRSRFSPVETFAYVLQPKSASGLNPIVILLHGSGTLPQQAFNLRFNGDGGVVMRPDSSPFIGMGLALARNGFTVIAPILGTKPAYNLGVPWLEVSLWGKIFSNKTGEGGSETLLVAEIRAFIDHAIKHGLGRADQVYVVGWNEGAYLAALTASVDERVRGVVRLSAPFDTRRYRTTDAGTLRDASFAHADCRLGDVAQAIMLGGKPLLYAAANDDAEERRRKPFRSVAIVDSITSYYKSLGRPKSFGIFLDFPSPDIQRRVTNWLSNLSGVAAGSSLTIGIPRVAHTYSFPIADVEQRANTTGNLLSAIPPCSSLVSFVTASDPDNPRIRDNILTALHVRGTVRGSGSILSRVALDSSRGYRLSLVRFGHSGTLAWHAVLAEPLGVSGPSPAVLSFNGVDNLDGLFAIGPRERTGYSHGYADALARRGFVVLVPLVPAWVPDGFAGLSAAQTGGNSSEWTVLIDEYTEALDALIKLNSVDSARIAAYGISFGGSTASIVSAVDTRIKGVVFNNIPLDYTTVFNRPAGAFTNLWFADACSVLDASLLAIAPRPMTWEAGEDPLVQNAGMDIISRMRERYRNFGAEELFTFTRHWGGHETFPENVRIFGR
jgi:dienelactone hydrolase